CLFISFIFFLLLFIVILIFFFFFFNDTATTEIYTLSLHDALPISVASGARRTRVIVGEQLLSKRDVAAAVQDDLVVRQSHLDELGALLPHEEQRPLIDV